VACGAYGVAIRMVAQIGRLAAELGCEPGVCVEGERLTLRLSHPSLGGVSDADERAARLLNARLFS
jgi:pterin-4a-carbinolamine dehydratase